jgi:hypothetical protein
MNEFKTFSVLSCDKGNCDKRCLPIFENSFEVLEKYTYLVLLSNHICERVSKNDNENVRNHKNVGKIKTIESSTGRVKSTSLKKITFLK